MLLSAALIAGGVGLAVVAVVTRDSWQPWLTAGETTGPSTKDHHEHVAASRVKLSPQGRANLRLDVQKVKLQSYWRTIQVPGVIVDSPGQSDRGITAPVVGVVTKVHAYPGDTVKSGDVLFSLRLISEYVQNSQAELFKNTQEIKLTQEQLARLKEANRTGSVPEARLIEVENQLRRLTTLVQTYRQDLLTRGLTPEQVEGVATGKFVKEVAILAPAPATNGGPPLAPDYAFEVQELKVQLGEQVQAGQLLGMLSNHQSLYIEGRGFKKEATLLERAAQKGWSVEAEFAEDDAGSWPTLDQNFQIRHLANTIDPASRTFGFFLPLTNQSRTYEKDGRTFLVWRFRPGQRVRLHVKVEEFQDVIVLPAEGVVREGPEAFVFRQNGDAFDRQAVQVLLEDRRHVVLDRDSLSPGLHVARNGAAALNRVLKAQQSAGEGGHGHDHDHHGHSHEH
jgi:multidrug efflux pump subunit AcrA (membrane-fusion protein)